LHCPLENTTELQKLFLWHLYQQKDFKTDQTVSILWVRITANTIVTWWLRNSCNETSERCRTVCPLHYINKLRDANFAVYFISLQNHSTCFGCHSTHHQEC